MKLDETVKEGILQCIQIYSSKGLAERKKPSSVAAAAIYFVCQLSGTPKTKKRNEFIYLYLYMYSFSQLKFFLFIEIEAVTKVSIPTIISSYKDFYLHRKSLIDSMDEKWRANSKVLKEK